MTEFSFYQRIYSFLFFLKAISRPQVTDSPTLSAQGELEESTVWPEVQLLYSSVRKAFEEHSADQFHIVY